jgi:hypothetical protein
LFRVCPIFVLSIEAGAGRIGNSTFNDMRKWHYEQYTYSFLSLPAIDVKIQEAQAGCLPREQLEAALGVLDVSAASKEPNDEVESVHEYSSISNE